MNNIEEIYQELEELYHNYISENNGEYPTALYIQHHYIGPLLKSNQNPVDVNKPTLGRPWYKGVHIYVVRREDTTFKYGFYDQEYVEIKRNRPKFNVTKLDISTVEFDDYNYEYPAPTFKTLDIPDAVLNPRKSQNNE